MMCAEITCDLWEEIAASGRPAVVYGMGNGADKLFDRLAALGVQVCGVCASDGFVRGQSFRTFPVMSLQQARATFPHAYLLVAFGSRREDVLSAVSALRSSFTLRIPDMPVVDTVFFDRAFFLLHKEELGRARDALADDTSRVLFDSLVRYKLTGQWEPLMAGVSHAEDIYALIGDSVRAALDLGAYRGDTVAEMTQYFPHLSSVTAVEPDRRNFKKLALYAEASRVPVTPVYAAVSATCGEAAFYGSGNRNASLGATSHEYRTDTVPLLTVDQLTDGGRVDYIKYDVEGAELAALTGSLETIQRERPILRIAAYHRSEDLYRLPLFIAECAPFYKLYLKRTPCMPAWEIDLICIPDER